MRARRQVEADEFARRGRAFGDARLERQAARAGSASRLRREDERHQDHRRRDSERERPVHQEREPAIEHRRSSSPRPIRAETYHGTIRRGFRSAMRVSAVTKSRPDRGRAGEARCYHATDGDDEREALVKLSESAATKVKELMAEEPAGEATVIRVAVQGGGCSGFEYALGFDSGAQEGDHQIEAFGVPVVVDPLGAPYLQGIDRFPRRPPGRVRDQQPKRVVGGGCGHSFQVEEGAEGGCPPPTPAAAPAAVSRTKSGLRCAKAMMTSPEDLSGRPYWATTGKARRRGEVC